MRWVLGSSSTSTWKTFMRLGVNPNVSINSTGDKIEDVEIGSKNLQKSTNSSANGTEKNASPKQLAMQQVSESVQRIAQEVAVIRSEVKKVRVKVDIITASAVCKRVENLPHNNVEPVTEDEADSIRSQISNSSSESKTGSIHSDDAELDVDSGLELGGVGGGAFSFERPYHKERENKILEDHWRKLFDKYDPEGFAEIPWPDFFNALNSAEFRKEIPEGKRQLLQHLGMVYSQHSTAISFQCFVNIMSGKRSRSFKCAVHHRDREVLSENDFHILKAPPAPLTRMARLIADEFLTEERDRKYYADHYRCLPPPFFIISVTLIELGFFTYYSLSTDAELSTSSSGPLPMDSPFVYRPDKREEVWRFLVYMVLHAGWVHLMFNLLVQLLVGLPLEMVHGSLRIGAIYMAGVLAGSLATSVFDPDVYLVGASGGVYALLAAHLANVLLNYNNMEFGILRLLGVFLIASVDVGFAIYDRYAGSGESLQPVSYVAHLAGALAGLTIGLVVLKNFEQRLREQCMWWVALGIYAACTLFAVLFNLLRPLDPLVTEFIQVAEPFPHPQNLLVNSF